MQNGGGDDGRVGTDSRGSGGFCSGVEALTLEQPAIMAEEAEPQYNEKGPQYQLL